MRLTDEILRLSATDLANHLACRHLTELNFAKALGLAEPPYWYDPIVEVLRKRGDEHERAYLDHLSAHGTEHVRIGNHPAPTKGSDLGPRTSDAAYSATTLEAMTEGSAAIVQAPLGDGRWRGFADVLLRRDGVPSKLGDYSYEVVDTKLARETKGGTILQLCLYTELVAELQGVMPEFMFVVSPGKGFEPERFRVSEYMDYYRMVKAALQSETAALDSRLRGNDPPLQTASIPSPEPSPPLRGYTGQAPGARTPDVIRLYPEPCGHCSICRWWKRCNDIRRTDDHLTFVAGISKRQIQELREHDVATLTELAHLGTGFSWRPQRGSRESIERAHHQARLQLQQKKEDRPVHELLPLVENEGLARLPEPSRADIFFDLESATFVGDHGLQYLWGYSDRQDNYLTYSFDWSSDARSERACFEHFMDFVAQQLRAFPDLHVYHFGHYEPSTLKQLAQRYGTREEELDDLLRAEVFVDLHSIVRQSLRAGVENYSLKDLEAFFGYEREMDLQQASKARHDLERGLELDVPLDEIPGEVRDQVLLYNEDDCRATEGLHRWLEKLRSDLIAGGAEILRPVVAQKEEDEEREGRRKSQRELAERLLRDIPADRSERTAEQQAQWLLGNMIQFHWREEKATWWEYFRMRELSDLEYLEEQTALAGLEFIESLPLPPRGRAPIHRYRFPAQESKIREEHKLSYAGGEILDDGFGEVVAIDYATRTIDVKKTMAATDVHPTAVFEFSNVKATPLEDAIFRAGEITVEDGIESGRLPRPLVDLVLARPPRFKDGFRDRIRHEDENGMDAAIRLVMELDTGVLPIQGPPGTGKTHIGARMACALLKSGKKVGVVANSHKVIDNFLGKLKEAGEEMDVVVKAVHKDGQSNEDGAFITYLGDNVKVREALLSGEFNVAGGTAWMWAREDFREAVDVLFVDEAGQMALANVVAAAQGAKNVVLLGDPQQLDQPQQGSHPEGVEVSALQHLLGEATTMPDDRGLFLEKTWRLANPICDYTSTLFYQGRLEGVDRLANLAIHAPPLIDEPGLCFLPVEHAGNQSASKEEAEAIRKLVHALVSPSGSASHPPSRTQAREEGGPASSGGAANSMEGGDRPKLASPPNSSGELIDGMSPPGREVGATMPTWTDRDGITRALTLDDILIVAPYNAQVSDIAALLPSGARVGTVDKFQGQEAPVVIYSMTTSTREDAPRGMEFLYSLNRLNVATSRAKCACILVANPAVLQPDCRSPRQMRLANAFCAFRDRASMISVP